MALFVSAKANKYPSPGRQEIDMQVRFALLVVLSLVAGHSFAAGLRGDPAAIADARAMVERMGGNSIWKELESVHFVHEWDLADREERYLVGNDEE